LSATPKKPYYYAGGRSVTLEPASNLIAVDDSRLAEQLPSLQASSTALRDGTPLRGGIRLIRRDNLGEDTLDRLQKAGVTQPVFRQDGAILVARRRSASRTSMGRRSRRCGSSPPTKLGRSPATSKAG
jgi:hypothetical protein